MKKIAFLTPWPNQKSGIADNAYCLVNALKKSYSIDVITDAQMPLHLDGVRIYDYTQVDFTDYDQLIYEIGNNIEFHHKMFDILQQYGGIVHLHDLVLHHFISEYIIHKEDINEYFEVIKKWYGLEIYEQIKALTLIHQQPLWETEEVGILPLFEEVLQYADGCIVHSDYVASKVQHIFPDLPVKKIWHFPFDDVSCANLDIKDTFDIGIFGGVQKNRQIATILKVAEALISKGKKIKLHIVGGVDISEKYLVEQYKSYDNIIFYGRLDDDAFKNALSKMNLCINLRYPTMGETSGIVIRCLQHCIPTLVSDLGWYHELPTFFPKVNMKKVEESLYAQLEHLLDWEILNNIQSLMQTFVSTHFTKKIIQQEYEEALSSFDTHKIEVVLPKLETVLKEFDIRIN